MTMKKVLLVGEHPYGNTGNSHMLNSILNQITGKGHDITVFACSPIGFPIVSKEYPIIEGGTNPHDWYGGSYLLKILSQNKFDVVCFIGIDVWVYSKIMPQLKELKKRDNFIWVSLFPYDCHYFREDWFPLLEVIDFPLVYSKYGQKVLSTKISNATYFRPSLFEAEKFKPCSLQEKKKLRAHSFSQHIKEDSFIFGFFGPNQFRKDPLRAIKAFYEVKKKYENIILYLHMNFNDTHGIFNIDQFIKDCGGERGDVLVKKQSVHYSTQEMVNTYNSIDCLLNTSLQEGLSWTLLEAMLCGLPIIAANNTAQKELLEGGAGIGVPSSEIAYLPTLSANGSSTYIESKACDFSSLVYIMESVLTNEKLREQMKEKELNKAKDWLTGVSDFNNVLEQAYICKNIEKPLIKKKEAVVFAQHSAAGDVFMTTRCLKDIKERHPDVPFYYMTQKKYQDILINNPYIDGIIDWSPEELNKYSIVYNPHGERILPGHWGRNSNSILSDFYWKVLMIEKPDDFFIELKKPEELGVLTKIFEMTDSLFPKFPIAILHTTGGDSEYRTYKYMGDVAKQLKGKYTTIQIGGKNDFPADADFDFRGMLSYRESAWVISKAKIAVTVDSFISHLCGALGVSQVCLFGSGNANVVKPLQVKGRLIEMSPDYCMFCKGLGPCSAAVRDCPVKCTGIHDPKTILENIKKIEEERL